jgi:hypothetical protein
MSVFELVAAVFRLVGSAVHKHTSGCLFRNNDKNSSRRRPDRCLVLRDHISGSGGAFGKRNVLGLAEENIGGGGGGESILGKDKFITTHEGRVEQKE